MEEFNLLMGGTFVVFLFKSHGYSWAVLLTVPFPLAHKVKKHYLAMSLKGSAA